MTRNSHDEEDYLADANRSAGCGAGVRSGGAQERATGSSRGGPIAYIYPAAVVVAVLLLLIMAAV
jgi:hypothetical protein